jgi:callose synthase
MNFELLLCVDFVYDLTSLFFAQTVSVGRRKFSANFQLVFRLIKGMIFLTFVSILVTLIALPHMTVQDVIVCILAFMPTGWGMLLVSGTFICFRANLCHCSRHLLHLSLNHGAYL